MREPCLDQQLVDAKFRMTRVKPVWKGMVVCIATGPSLTVEQIELVRQADVPVIVVNDAYLMVPFADLVYFADVKWWRWQQEGTEKPAIGMSAAQVKQAWAEFKGQKCSIKTGSTPCAEASVLYLENARAEGLSTQPTGICTGSNSGYQALNIATLAGGNPVVLVGYDCRDVGGKHHYFGDHPDKSKPPYTGIKGRFKAAAAMATKLNINVINATPGSAIDCFTKEPLESVLSHQKCAVVP